MEAAAARQFQLPEGEQRRFSGAVKRAFEGACAALVAEHAALAEQVGLQRKRFAMCSFCGYMVTLACCGAWCDGFP